MKLMNSTRGQKGFTLVEVLVTSAIFGIILAAIYLLYVTNESMMARGENKIDVQQNARVALEMMAREIRVAGYDPATPAVIPLQVPATAMQTATSSEIRFIADVTGDGVTDRVAYRFQGTQIIRESSSWVGGAWSAVTSSPVADNVSVLTFTYFDGSDVATATLANIRRIKIAMRTLVTARGRQDAFPLEMDVRLRNL